MAEPERHLRAREQTITLMVDAVRTGDYREALLWLNTLASVDPRFPRAAETIRSAWRERARRLRAGDAEHEAQPGDISGYQGLFGSLLEHSLDGIVLSDVDDGWMLECSHSFEQITGYPRERLLGHTSVELGLIEPQVRERAVSHIQVEGSIGMYETRLRRSDGEVLVVEFSSQLLAGDELLLTIARDITARP